MKRIKVTLLILLMIFGVFSCQKGELAQETENLAEMNEEIEPKGMMVLGEKLENPYSVENMKRAFESLKSNVTLKSVMADTFEIVANTF